MSNNPDTVFIGKVVSGKTDGVNTMDRTIVTTTICTEVKSSMLFASNKEKTTQDNGYLCFIHMANSEQYQAITGHQPPHKSATAKDYTSAGLPWFDYYDDSKTLPGVDALNKLTCVATKVIDKGTGVLPDNDQVQPKIVKTISKGNVVRDGEF